MILYTVIANRYGDDEKHSYLVGVFSDKTKAARASIAEEYWRGGKYDCVILETKIDEGFVKELKNKEEWCSEHCLPGSEYEKEINKRILVSYI